MATYSMIKITPTAGTMTRNHVCGVTFPAIEMVMSQESSLWAWGLWVAYRQVSPDLVQ